MSGATHFLTPSGKASLVDDSAYGWGADVLAAYFRCDPERLQKLLPGSLIVADGTCMTYFGSFHSVSEDKPNAILTNPAGGVYCEAAFSIACTHNGKAGYFPVFVWVDREWSLVRGWLNGYPKKLGQISIARPHALNPIAGGLKVGAVAGGICSRHGFTLLRLGIEVERAGDAGDLKARPATFGYRHWPALDPSHAVVSEIVEVNRTDLAIDAVWVGKPILEVGDAPDEELEWFRDRELLSGVLYSYGFRIGGSKVVERL